MARKVTWTGPAWDDLEAAAKYIERDSMFYAAALVREAYEAADSLVAPRLWLSVSRWADK